MKTVPIKANIASLTWLSGVWQSKQNVNWIEEFWSIPKDNVILGTARLHDSTGLIHTDLTWIIEENQYIYSKFRRYDSKFRAYTHLFEPIRFDLVELRENYAVFHCPEPGNNAWMVYERTEAILIGKFLFGDELEVLHTHSLVLSSKILP
ncbi:MAG: DUF6265 family protein [Fimbriimonadaceae bacterium]